MLSTIKAICVLPRGPQLAAQCHTKRVTAGAREEEHRADGGPGQQPVGREVKRTAWGSARTQERLRAPVLKEPGRPAKRFTPRRKIPLPSHVGGEGSYADRGVEIKSTNVKTWMGCVFLKPKGICSTGSHRPASACVSLALGGTQQWAGKCLTTSSPRAKA